MGCNSNLTHVYKGKLKTAIKSKQTQGWKTVLPISDCAARNFIPAKRDHINHHVSYDG